MTNRIPTNDQEQVELDLDERGVTLVYLLDANIVDIFEQVAQNTGVDLFDLIDRKNGRTFMFTNDVGVELMNRPKSFDPRVFQDHLINSSGGMAGKENRFLIEEEGEVRVAYGTLVSSEDWGQILACQNHDRFKLVTNDVKLGRNAIRVIGESRIKTPHSLLLELMEQDPNNEELKKAFQYIESRKIPKMRKGEKLRWEKPPKPTSEVTDN